MSFDRAFFMSPTGQVILIAVALVGGVLAVRWQHRRPAEPLVPNAKSAPAVPLPKTLVREGARFVRPPAASMPAPPAVQPFANPTVPAKSPELPLTLFTAVPEVAKVSVAPTAPYGRLIPCRTVLALESNRLETPVIGLVTEDVWHEGKRVVPAGAEVHGRAALDRARERIAAQGTWHIVWRTQDEENGTDLAVEGLVLDRDFDPSTGVWGESDGSAGLRGQVVRTNDERELKLFAATFLASATAALQDQRLTAGLLGEASAPAATVRNAVLAGAGAILREHAQQLREAIARDGFYLRVPAGKSFYLYLTQTLDRSQVKRTGNLAQSMAPTRP
jgi:hypothetical protein